MNRLDECMQTDKRSMSRRQAFRLLGISALVSGAALTGLGCKSKDRTRATPTDVDEVTPTDVDIVRAKAIADCYAAAETNQTDPLAFQRCGYLTPKKEQMFDFAKAEFEKMNTGGRLESGYVYTPDSGGEFYGTTGLKAFKPNDIRSPNGLTQVGYIVSIQYNVGEAKKHLVVALEQDGTVAAVTHLNF